MYRRYKKRTQAKRRPVRRSASTRRSWYRYKKTQTRRRTVGLSFKARNRRKAYGRKKYAMRRLRNRPQYFNQSAYRTVKTVSTWNVNLTWLIRDSLTFNLLKIQDLMTGVSGWLPTDVDDQISPVFDAYLYKKLKKIQCVAEDFRLEMIEYAGDYVVSDTDHHLHLVDPTGQVTVGYAAYTAPMGSTATALTAAPWDAQVRPADTHYPSPCRLQNDQGKARSLAVTDRIKPKYWKANYVKERFITPDADHTIEDQVQMIPMRPGRKLGWTLHENPYTNKWFQDDWVATEATLNCAPGDPLSKQLNRLQFQQQRLDLTGGALTPHDVINTQLVPNLWISPEWLKPQPSVTKFMYPETSVGSRSSNTQVYLLSCNVSMIATWALKGHKNKLAKSVFKSKPSLPVSTVFDTGCDADDEASEGEPDSVKLVDLMDVSCNVVDK